MSRADKRFIEMCENILMNGENSEGQIEIKQYVV